MVTEVPQSGDFGRRGFAVITGLGQGFAICKGCILILGWHQGTLWLSYTVDHGGWEGNSTPGSSHWPEFHLFPLCPTICARNMRGKLHRGEEQGCHEVSRLELWLFRPIDIKLKQRHPAGATFSLIKRPVPFSGCTMWAEAKPRGRKGDPPSLCRSLSGVVHRLGAGGKGTLSQAARAGDLRVVLPQWVWPSLVLSVTRPALSGHPELLRQIGILPQKKGWPHWRSPTHQAQWHLSLWTLFKSETRGAQKQNISSGALGREHT